MPEVLIGPNDSPTYPGGHAAVYRALVSSLYGSLTVLGLYGILLAQSTVFGLSQGSRASRIERLVVIALVALCTVIVGADVTIAKRAFLDGFGSPALVYAPYASTPLFVKIFADVCVSAVCQAVYGVRAYRLSNRFKPFGVMLALLHALVFVSGLLAGGYYSAVYGRSVTEAQLDRLQKIIQTHYVASATMDVCTCLGVLLPLLRSKTGFHAGRVRLTDSIIRRILVYTLASTTLTVAGSISLAVIVYSPPAIFAHLSAVCPIVHFVYANSVLFSYITRDWLKASLRGSSGGSDLLVGGSRHSIGSSLATAGTFSSQKHHVVPLRPAGSVELPSVLNSDQRPIELDEKHGLAALDFGEPRAI